MYICYICRFKTYTYIRRASTCINFPLKVVVAVPPPLPPPTPTPPPPHPRPRVTYGLFSPTKQSLIPIYSKTIRETIHVHPPISGRLCSIFLHTCISTLTYLFVFSLGIKNAMLFLCVDDTWNEKKRKDKREGMENMIFHYLLYLIEISSKTQ